MLTVLSIQQMHCKIRRWEGWEPCWCPALTLSEPSPLLCAPIPTLCHELLAFRIFVDGLRGAGISLFWGEPGKHSSVLPIIHHSQPLPIGCD